MEQNNTDLTPQTQVAITALANFSNSDQALATNTSQPLDIRELQLPDEITGTILQAKELDANLQPGNELY